MVLSNQQPNDEDLQDEAFLELNQESSDLYSMLHARFILTSKGMAKVYQKYLNGTYGQCPRALCDRQKVLPVGLSDTLRTSRFKNFCPRCEEVYLPKSRQVNVDGACFGTSFPQAFIMHYPMAVILPPKIYHYEPKIFGFKIAGKRGSHYYNPPRGNVKYMEDSVQALDLQDAIKKGGHVESLIPKFEDKLQISGGDSGANTAASLHKETELLDDSKANAGAAAADTNKGGKKNRKKNKK